MMVTLELLRAKHGIRQVSQRRERQHQAHDELGAHMRSQPLE